MKSFIEGIFSDRRNSVPLYLLLIGAAIIFWIGWDFTSTVSQHADILFWDEANYMNAGKEIPQKFNRAWGPSYSIWYKFLSFFQSDSIELYYLNYRLMAVLPAITLFIFLAISNVRLWVSLALALFFIFADINLPVWPKISHFCIFAFLTGMIVARYIPYHLVKISFVSLVALFISYSRPEFYLTYMAVLALWAGALFVPYFRNKRAIYFSVGLIFLGFLVQLKLKNPLFNFQGDRSAIAFAQHFMLNYFSWENIDQDFWITWMPYYEELFQNAASLKEAYLANSKLFNIHLVTNLQNYLTQGFYLFSDAMLPDKMISISHQGRVIILLLGGLLMIFVASFDKVLESILNNFSRNMLTIVLLMFFVGPTIISCFVIYPRNHYMIFHYIFILFIISITVFSIPTENKEAVDKKSLGMALIVVAAVVFFMPNTSQYDYFDLWREEKSQANLLTVEKLRSYHYTDSVRIVENEGGINLFLDKNYIWVRGFMKDRDWVDYLKEEEADIVYVTPSLTKYPSLKSDSTWYSFTDNPGKYGFEKVLTGNHQPYLYIKKELLGAK